jgi:uracil-DNA glycosylase
VRKLTVIEEHQAELRECRRCPNMIGPVVVGEPVASEILLVGQAPGDKEPKLGRPFAWTAGKNLFKWFAQLGVDEQQFRARVYMAAICRCFPGKAKQGDRVPSDEEIAACAPWLDRELEIVRPRLVIPVGKLAIERFVGEGQLKDVIGKQHDGQHGRRRFDVIPLPHPSGASTWYHMAPGKQLTAQALALIGAHPAWQGLLQ